MADGGQLRQDRSAAPRVILEGGRAEAPSAAPSILDWSERFGRRSPLSRKIITFNLIALGVLLTGVLYLNQAQSGLFEQRARAMITEARLVASVLAQEAGTEGFRSGDTGPAMETLRGLQGITVSRLFLFDREAKLVGVITPDGRATPADEIVTIERQTPTAFISIMADIWDRASRVFAAQQAPSVSPLGLVAARPLAEEALSEGGVVQARGSTGSGDQIVSVAVPITAEDVFGPLGVLVLTTRPGDVDEFIHEERVRILQVFALAIICSIVLSLVLANTIVRPLRFLAEAAQEGGTRNAKQLNPERINIPDMTGRPDEIGYLSGAMRIMTAALFDRIESNESFAADVAHEIKNPLTSLRSAVETMPYAKTEEAQNRLLDVIKKDVDRLDRLVTDISNASRLDSELVRDRMEPFDLHGLLANLISFNEAQAEKAGARLMPKFGETPLEITGLEQRLAQVFVNLITNAISFAREGDRIRVNTRVTGEKVVVTVEDDGPGIPDDNLADVFERFYSERPETEAFGNHSGLGLAISRQIIQAHGGEIWAENIRSAGAGLETPPEGARFVVELPV
ncbi:MAG: sensor histidine kinase [Pseudomonadota bacterium]